MPSAIDNYKRKIAVELERRRRCAENNMTTMTEFDIYEDDDDDENDGDDFSPIRLGTRQLYTPNPIIEPTDELHQTQIVLDDLDIFIIKKSRMSVVERNPTSMIENNLVKAYQPVIEVAPSSLLRRTQYEFINVNILTSISLSFLYYLLNLGKSR